ncbi:MAG: hypothetical protein LC648_07360 [Novosphingobium sp.]|nr:hypothetical protein [Novosphingobium sp.]
MFGDAADDRAFRPVLVNDFAGTALAADGSFLFRDGGTIRRIASDRTVRVVARELAMGNFGIAPGPNDSVFAAEHGKRRVISVSVARGPRTVAASSAPWAPTGVAWRNDSLYLLEPKDHAAGTPDRMRLRRIGADGRERVLANVTIPAP